MFKELFQMAGPGFTALWIGGAVVGLGLTGFGVWAVYKIVMAISAGG